MKRELIVYVVDAGSVARGNFHWVSSRNFTVSSSDPNGLAKAIADDLNQGSRVALGYESPLFVPLDADPRQLGLARRGECQPETGNRPFSAAAGATVLATGIQSLAWILSEVKRLAPNASATTRWSDFQRGGDELFVWEVFVSGSEKAFPASHAGDAALAIAAFQIMAAQTADPTRISAAAAFSLCGAAIVGSGLSSDLALISEPCVVIRPIFSPEESRQRLADYQQRQKEAKQAKEDKKKGGR